MNKFQMQFPILFAFLSFACGHVSAADAPTQPIAKRGALIFSDDFARTELGDKWRVTTPTFVIADGVLRCSQTKPEHGAVGRVDIGQKDLVLEFKFRFARWEPWLHLRRHGREGGI